MIGFCDLNYAAKAVFLVFAFMNVCMSLCMMPGVFRRKRIVPDILISVCFLLSAAVLVLLAAHVKSYHPSWTSSPEVDTAASIPLVIPVMLLLAVTSILIIQAAAENKYQRDSITRSSVKESFDYLNTGLCFAYRNGMVMLINHRMNTLCHDILGRDLQNANTFWKSLCEGKVKENVEVISAGNNPSFLLSDKSVWTFSFEDIGGITQIAAAETTRQYMLTEELKEKNMQLSVVNERLIEYGKHVDELTREKERLETKVSIHRELGQALLAARRYLQSDSESPDEVLNMLKRNISMLRFENEAKSSDNPFDILMKTAGSVGIDVGITGRLPEAESTARLFFEAASEALTNAVRHAGAKKLNADMSEDDIAYYITFTNDGNIPQTEIVEGGGLSSIRRKCEQAGGTLSITCRPVFKMDISIPKKRGGNL